MKDFKQLESGDLDLSGGDLTYTEASQQHMRDIILTLPGEMKHAPDRGVGVVDYFNDENPEDLLRQMRQQLLRDGVKVKGIAQDDNGQIEIDGYYEADFKR